MYELPKTLEFPLTFQRVLRRVVEEGYQDIDAGSPADIHDVYAGYKEAFDADLANAIEETRYLLLGTEQPETGDWLGELYDLAELMGYSWYDAEGGE